MPVNVSSDHYATLGLAPTADLAAIRVAFKQLIDQSLHGGQNPGPGETSSFVKLAVAFETLSDPRQRAGYDAKRTAAQRADDDDDQWTFINLVSTNTAEESTAKPRVKAPKETLKKSQQAVTNKATTDDDMTWKLAELKEMKAWVSRLEWQLFKDTWRMLNPGFVGPVPNGSPVQAEGASMPCQHKYWEVLLKNMECQLCHCAAKHVFCCAYCHFTTCSGCKNKFVRFPGQ